MATNVLIMKYPYSDNGRWTKSEVTSVDPSKVVLSKSARKIAEKQAEDVGKCDSAVSDIKAIDMRIAKLIAERDFVWHCLEKDSQKATKEVFGFTFDFADSVVDNFNRAGFSSVMVKKAVKKVRDALFDDSSAAFREIVCADVSYGGDESELMFTFEHAPSGKCFRIDVPVFPAEGIRSQSYYGRERGVGPVYGICVVFAFSSCCCGAISYHYDVRVVREQLRLFVERGFVPILGKEELSRWLDDDDRSRMSYSDYLAEAE